ncbi:MAG: RNA polymerase sigma factor [Pseudonocardia sp.]
MAKDGTSGKSEDSQGSWAADALLVARARCAGPGGVEYRYLRDALQEYGLGVLTGMGQRRILTEMERRGVWVPRPAPRDFAEELPTLRFEAVTAALDSFMTRQVMEGRWNPHGGAALRTFFTTKAIFCFADQYRRYYREETSRESLYDDMRDAPDRSQPRREADPETTAVNRDLISRTLTDASDTIAWIVVLSAQGYTQKEIATELGMTEAAVNSALRRFRDRLR